MGQDPFPDAGFPDAFDLDLSGYKAGLNKGSPGGLGAVPQPYAASYGDAQPRQVLPPQNYGVPDYAMVPCMVPNSAESMAPDCAFEAWGSVYAVQPPLPQGVPLNEEPAVECVNSPCSMSSHDVAVVPDFDGGGRQQPSSSTSNSNNNHTNALVPQESASSCRLVPTAPQLIDPLVMDPLTTSGGDCDSTRTRRECVMRYKEKKARRLYTKKIRYHLRKINADKRPRFKGRFVKKQEAAGPSGEAASQESFDVGRDDGSEAKQSDV